ncbi:MAG: histidine kinase, partial [Bacteroidota bacterium]
ICSQDTHKVQAGFRLSRQLMKTEVDLSYYFNDQSLCLGQKLGFAKAEYNAAMQYCYLAGQLGRWEEAHRFAERLVAFAEGVKKPNFIAGAWQEMAQTAIHLQLPQTEDYLDKAIALSEDLPTLSGRHRIHYYYAVWLQNEGRYEEAMQEFQQLVRDNPRKSPRDNRLQITYLSSLAKLWLELERPEEAEPIIRQTYLIRKSYGELPQLALGEEAMGFFFTQTGQLDSAIHYLELALQHYQQIGNQRRLSHVANNLSMVYAERNQPNKQRQYLEMSIDLERRMNEPLPKVRGLLNLGLFEVEQSRYGVGMRYLREGEEIANSLDSDMLKRLAYRNLAEALYLQGRYEQALDYLNQYHDLKDSMLNVDRMEGIRRIEFKYQQEKKQKELSRLEGEKLIQETELLESRLANDETAWRMLYLLALLCLGGLIAWWFWHRQKLTARNQQTELQQRLLRSQMNPHFLFNALNSIQRLFQDRDNQRANEYLNGFGQLMNDILDQSGKAWIPMVDELRTLELYLRMEQYRLDNGFRYALHLPEEVDPYQLEIPPLILQPLVENAIWHGIAPLEHEGLIEISFRQREDKLECRIIDNGVGLSQSQRKDRPEHQPKALSILTERLGIDSAFQLRERKDTQGNTLGTEAFLLIPYRVSTRSSDPAK